jgi:hypothetical protein
MIAEPPISDDEMQLYYDYLIQNHYINHESFTILDVDERRQYSAEELALEVV